MSGQTKKEKPEVYALRQDGGGWQFSRRDFLKAAGIGAAAVGIGLNSRFVRPASGPQRGDHTSAAFTGRQISALPGQRRADEVLEFSELRASRQCQKCL